MTERGKPKMVVSDNGSAFNSNTILTWADQSRIAWHYIEPGKPKQNAFIVGTVQANENSSSGSGVNADKMTTAKAN